MAGRVRRFVEANLHQADLSPASVIQALQLKRATIYRWFEHEGGLYTQPAAARGRQRARAFPAASGDGDRVWARVEERFGFHARVSPRVRHEPQDLRARAVLLKDARG